MHIPRRQQKQVGAVLSASGYLDNVGFFLEQISQLFVIYFKVGHVDRVRLQRTSTRQSVYCKGRQKGTDGAVMQPHTSEVLCSSSNIVWMHLGTIPAREACSKTRGTPPELKETSNVRNAHSVPSEYQLNDGATDAVARG